MNARTLHRAVSRLARGSHEPRRAAAVFAWLAGLGFGIPGVYGTFSFAEHRSVATFAGFPTYGGGPFERVGLPTSVPLLSAFVGVCLLECVSGWLLWCGRRPGRTLSWVLLPAELVLWIGFALPFGPPLGAARTVLIVWPRAVTVSDGATSGGRTHPREY